MAYERINWQNGESGNTPLNANNLNRMDMTLEEHDQKIGDHDYEIENLKTGEQGITEELNKKMDRINPQGSGTLSIPAVNADNINAQTVEADEIKVTKVGSKGGTAPVVFDNDILVNGITTPIGSLASSASAKAESAERIANEADREAGTAKTTASTAYSRVQENIFRTDKLEGIVGGGVGESIPQYTYYDGKYLRPDGEIANYNDSARVIEFEINKNSDSGCNVIFKNVDLIPTEASILCGFYNAAGILLGEEMRGLIIMADFDEDTGKMTRQYISYCVVPAPYYAKYVRISGIANGVVDIAVQNTLSDAVAELQSRSTSALVLTNPSPLPATDGKKILGIDAKGNSTQNGTPTPTNPIEIIDASEVVEALDDRILTSEITVGKNWSGSTDATCTTVNFSVVGNTEYIFDVAKALPEVTQIRCVWREANSGSSYISYKNIDTNMSIIAPTNAKVCALQFKASASPSADVVRKVRVYTQSNTITLPYTLRSVGTVADELIVNEDGSGKLIRRVSTATYDGTEVNWKQTATDRTFYLIRDDSKLGDIVFPTDSNSKGEGLCSHFEIHARNGIALNQFALTSGYNIMFYHSTQTIDEWKAWLSQNPITVYAVLKTPTETPLTPEQVASIRQLQTYKGTTIIDSEMQIESVSYSGDVKAYVDGFHTYSTKPTICGYEEDGTPRYRVKIYGTTPSTASRNAKISDVISGQSCVFKSVNGSIRFSDTVVFPINYFLGTSNYSMVFLDADGLYMNVATVTSKPCEIEVEYTLKDPAPAAASVLSLDEETEG